MTRILLVLAAVASLVVAASCGVPLDDEPRVINRATTTTVATTTTEATGSVDRVELFFVDEDGALEGLEVQVQREAEVRDAVSLLLKTKPRSPLATRIPAGTELLGLTVFGDVVQIDLTNEIGEITGEAQKQAFAQFVFTVVAFPEHNRVAFMIEGNPIAAPTDRENLEVVSAEDYEPPLRPS